MVTPQPHEASVACFEELIRLPFDAQLRIGQIEWQLRALHKQNPGDPNTTIALLAATIMAGKAKESHELAGHAWGLRHVMDAEQRNVLIGWLTGLGECERALELASTLDASGWLTTTQVGMETLGAMGDAAYQLGDLDALDQMATKFSHPRHAIILDIINSLSADARVAFRDYQQSLRNIIAGQYTMRRVGTVYSDEGADIHDCLYVTAATGEVPALRSRIYDQIDELCNRLGLVPGAYCPKITLLVRPLTSLGIAGR